MTVAPSAVRWRLGAVLEVIEETPHAKTIVLDLPGWPGHVAGQHVDIRLTAEDGYQTERSYSIGSPPEQSTVAWPGTAMSSTARLSSPTAT